MSWSNYERMTLKQRRLTDKRDSDVDVLSRLKTSWSWEKDDHSNDVVLLCDQDSRAVTMKSKIFIKYSEEFQCQDYTKRVFKS